MISPTQVIANLGKNVRLPDGSIYRFTGATIRKNKDGTVFYQAEVQDLAAPCSVRICRMEDLEVVM